MTEYLPYHIALSENQKKRLAKALEQKTEITIRLSHNQL